MSSRRTRRTSRPVRCARAIAVACCLQAAALSAAPDAAARQSGPAEVTGSQLAAAGAAVLRADVAGTAWHADAARGRLVVTADRTVGAGDLARIAEAVKAPAGVLEIRRTAGRLTERVAGGDVIVGPGGVRCTVGFNVEDSSGARYALTAGHCTATPGTWSIGPVAGSSFPGDDFGLVEYADPSTAEGGVRGPGGTLVDISAARIPSVGERVCGTGGVTGARCGTVTALNATVNYGSGNIVYGLVRTNLCTQPGDSGGPLYSGRFALGLASGGSGNCASGGTSYFQPVVEALNAYGVSVF
ncbi:S1 family peptidase [Streptomyces sp. Ru87]|uniref:S1 family peptidase n=1 Tax=Streptomyces sp. Ru87 TaxID=2044307 RepID=UPI000BFA369A|nr:S1 family peptidase [Streptomyces sp. Ru87]PGH52127.1 serine protease [Streptomyces sp. Ru87]